MTIERLASMALKDQYIALYGLIDFYNLEDNGLDDITSIANLKETEDDLKFLDAQICQECEGEGKIRGFWHPSQIEPPDDVDCPFCGGSGVKE